MKKRYLLLIPVVICLIVSAAAIGYIQIHPEQAPEGTAFLVQEASKKQAQAAKEAEDESLTASQKQAKQLTEKMSLEQKLYQMLFVTPEALTQTEQVVRAGAATQAAIEKRPVGGVLYTNQSLQGKAQIKDMLSHTQSYAKESGSGIPVFLGVQEQEGSNAPVAQALQTTNILKADKSTDDKTAYALGQTLAEELRSVGFTVNFAPTVTTDKLAASEVKGLQENQVLSAVSAFPNSGNTDISAFQACIKQNPAFMIVSHDTIKEYDTVPCSVSSKVMTDTLRKKLGYKGIVMTDALSDTKLTDAYTEGKAAVLAVQAGADMLLEPSDVDAVYQALFQAVSDGKLTEQRIDESVQRILTAKIDGGLIA